MGRAATGWNLRKRGNSPFWRVWFTVNGERVERSTGERTKGAAAKAAARIFEAALHPRHHQRLSGPLGDTLNLWLKDLEQQRSPTWVATCRGYADLWRDLWPAATSITSETAAAYVSQRLEDAAPPTVRKELSALRRFLEWCEDHAIIDTAPRIKSPKGGTGYESLCLTPQQAERVLAELPDRSKNGHPVRSYFTLLWELGLRKWTIGRLQWSNVDLKRRTLHIGVLTDKRQYARDLPLSKRAAAALKAVAPKADGRVGLVFGLKDFRTTLREAAKRAGLPAELAGKLTDRIWRHSAATRLASDCDDVPALMYVLGHKRLETTSRYLHGGLDRARALIERDSVALIVAPAKQKRKSRPRRTG